MVCQGRSQKKTRNYAYPTLPYSLHTSLILTLVILQPLRLGLPDEGHEAKAAHEAVHDAAAVADRLAVTEDDLRRYDAPLLLLMLLLLLLLHDRVLVHA